MNMEQSNERKSNFELLRIILILMVIVLHYFNGGMGGLLNEVKKGSVNYYLGHFIESLCIIAVNVFIIVTGYFSYKKEYVHVSKAIKLYSLSIFYGIAICSIMIFINKTHINFEILQRIASAIFSRWFVVIFCILYLLIPYINKLINSITQKQYRILLIINIVFFYIWRSFFTKTTILDSGCGIVNFVNLYLIGAYIKKYRDEKISKRKSILVYLSCTLITTIFSLFASRAWAYLSIFNLISSIALFEFFKSIKIKNNKFINYLSTYTFSTYIIHENSFLVTVLYRTVFHSENYWNSQLMIINMIGSVLGIYIICIAIEFIRRKIFYNIIDSNIDKIKYRISCE